MKCFRRRGSAILALIGCAAISLLLGDGSAASAQTSLGECQFRDRGLSSENLIASCTAALSRPAPDNVRALQHYTRAYALNETERFDAAVEDLNETIRLQPQNANARHERAYSLNSLAKYSDALADLAAEETLRPNEPALFQERAHAHRALGDMQATYQDWDRVVQLAPENPESWLSRANAALWLGDFDGARADRARAMQLATARQDEKTKAAAHALDEKIRLWATSGPKGAAGCLEADRRNDYSATGLIGDCTRAYLDSATGPQKAAALTVRAMTWLMVIQDESSSVADFAMAVVLEPRNAMWHSNLGFAYLNASHSWAAAREFDEAIAVEPTFFAYAGRASARYRLKDVQGALSDAEASQKIRPNDTAALVLGDLALDRGDRAAAQAHWLAAYRLGSSEKLVAARLQSIGVRLKDVAPPRKDG